MISSAAIEQIAYDKESQVLQVEFCSGAVYEYTNVPPSAVMNLASGDAACITRGETKCGRWFIGKAPSRGAAFHRYIKNQYSYTRIK